MFLNLVILLFFVNTIYSDESEEGKYIDLLPDDEKREFLENVARRILEEVESNDTIKKSGELSDGQLNKHSAYVSKVMKEEENDLIKKYNNTTSRKKKDVRSNDHVHEVQEKKEDEERKESGEKVGRVEQIDITLRQGKASIREHETDKQGLADTLVVTDKFIPEESTKEAIVIVTEESNGETQTGTSTKETTRKDVAFKLEKKNKDDKISTEIIIDTKSDKQQPETSNHSLKPSSDINIPVQVVYGVQVVDGVQNVQKGSVKHNLNETIANTQPTMEDINPDGGEYIYQSREENGQNDETRKTVTVMDNYEPKKCWSSEESSKTSTTSGTSTKKSKFTDDTYHGVTNCDGKPMKFETTSQWIVIDPPDVTGGIYESIDITRSKNTNYTDVERTTETPTIFPNIVDITLPIKGKEKITEVDIQSNNTKDIEENYKDKSTSDVVESKINSYKDETSKRIPAIHTTTIEPITTSSTSTITNDKPVVSKQEKLEVNPTIVISTSNNRFEVNKLKTSGLRIGNVETQLDNTQNNLLEFESQYKENNIKELKVYEIPSGKPLFVTNEPSDMPKNLPKIDIQDSGPGQNGEQPNYVPIYNYSPNNAYFNAYNRLGPNYEDEEGGKKSDLIKTNVLRIKADSSDSIESRERTNKKYYLYNSVPIIKKIRSKILLPPLMPKQKKKKFNPQIYLDDYEDTEEDGYFNKKKIRNKYMRNKKKKFEKTKKNIKQKLSLVDNDSIQVDEMFMSGTVKNHIEAVRQFLSSKNYYSFYEPNVKNKKKKKNKKQQEIKPLDVDATKSDNDFVTINVSKKELDKIKVPAVDMEQESPSDKNRRKKLKRLLRTLKSRFAKYKPNKRPKTGLVSNKPPKNDHGIDLDYYFGRTVSDVSDSNLDEVIELTRSEQSSLEGQLTFGNLDSVDSSVSRGNYEDYRRTKSDGEGDDNPSKGDKNKDDEPPANQPPKQKPPKNDSKINVGSNNKFTMKDFNLIKDISNIKDLVPNVLKMQKLVGISERSGYSHNLNNYINVLYDMIKMNNRALMQYDWLGSAVDIQSALRKLIDLTEQLNDGDFDVHPADWELFKYVFYIYETIDLDIMKKSKKKRKMLHPDIPLQNNKDVDNKWLKETLKLIPKTNKKVVGSKKLKKYGPYFSLRTQLRIYEAKLKEKQRLIKKILDFQEFLNSARDNLVDLHDAIKHIGLVSKQKTAKWFKNIKDVYLTKPRNQELLTVLLHLSLNRVINLLEESAKEGVERSFVSYVRRESNAPKVRSTKEEMLFSMLILRELGTLEN